MGSDKFEDEGQFELEDAGMQPVEVVAVQEESARSESTCMYDDEDEAFFESSKISG